jgi:hypothetical protein
MVNLWTFALVPALVASDDYLVWTIPANPKLYYKASIAPLSLTYIPRKIRCKNSSAQE